MTLSASMPTVQHCHRQTMIAACLTWCCHAAGVPRGHWVLRGQLEGRLGSQAGRASWVVVCDDQAPPVPAHLVVSSRGVHVCWGASVMCSCARLPPPPFKGTASCLLMHHHATPCQTCIPCTGLADGPRNLTQWITQPCSWHECYSLYGVMATGLMACALNFYRLPAVTLQAKSFRSI